MHKAVTGVAVIAAVSCVIAVFYSKSLITPYVSFDEAKMSPDAVQVLAEKTDGESVLETPAGIVLKVKDVKGVEFISLCLDQSAGKRILNADRLVLVGTYDPEQKMFVAQKVLTKCPSKYAKEK